MVADARHQMKQRPAVPDPMRFELKPISDLSIVVWNGENMQRFDGSEGPQQLFQGMS